MTTTGLMALETGDPIDFARMRRQRFDRVLASMERHRLDVLMLGKPANVRYVTGARSLWTAGRRPFAPGAIVLRDRREFHVMGLWDFGVPKDLPKERIFPPSWNPMQLMESVQRIAGHVHGSRIGVDHLSPLFSRLLAEAFPGASLVDGATAMLEARAVKTAEEIACIRTSIAVAEAALMEAVAALRPGVTERALLGVFEKKAAGFGVTVPVAQGWFCVQPAACDDASTAAGARVPMRQISSQRPVQAGEMVTLGGGVLYAGYESDVGRTWLCGGSAPPSVEQRGLFRRWREACDAMATGCRPGRTAADLRRAFEKLAPLPPAPIAHGSGLGLEPPLVGAGLGVGVEDRYVLLPGMVLVLQPYVWQEGVGGFWAKETLLITEAGHQRLTSFPHGPLGHPLSSRGPTPSARGTWGGDAWAAQSPKAP